MARSSKIFTKFSLLFSLCLAGCYDPVTNLKPTTFEENDLDRSMHSRIVNIISLMPARADVDNSYNRYRSANITGMTIGSIFTLGGAVGGFDGMVLGWYLGASLGQALGGSMIPPVLHPKSLIIVFKDPLDPKIHQSVEIARPCEFKLGHAYAVLVEHHKRLETRIQPNNFQACLKKAKALKEDQKDGLSYQMTQEDVLEQVQFDEESFMPPVGQGAILNLANPAYHSPYGRFFQSTEIKNKPVLSKKQLRLLKRHRTLRQESFPKNLTPPPHPQAYPRKTGREQWHDLNSFGQGF